MSNHNLNGVDISVEDDEENKFILECIETFEKEVLRKPLDILIWGPAKPFDTNDEYKTRLYEKRVGIKDQLKRSGHNALFSEEIGDQAKRKFGFMPNLTALEKIQIEKADLVVMLRVSYGTTGEFHDFYNNPDCARKMCVFFDGRHKDSYTHNGSDETFVTLGGKLVEFSYPDDIVNCNLLGMVNDYVRKVQGAIFLSTYKKY